ncbi:MULTISPECIES: ABC transporter ATP-binding protein [unclassified Candidatus Nanosynbacter]|jgi:ABC-type antimicrobial peptide transport system, ATPase component|uniref:ABC transporter ATP-binding protein n=1 Tax=unclassified Candidatus Nanosynbacter TaxID=2725944 RepID=UPI00101CAADD|nr:MULTISPECIES: ABC transporter ATP-binding protein [unclassified Candidatus Nanosynbacter]MCJ1963121.1 ABC transporter ATP-binding protein [Candidatus Nanosynbacter sp. TM7-033]MCP9492772.1 ABC transporter ATP-binding protein [Candidatus Nanosynbacter sp. P2B_S1_bin.0.1]UOG67611.1 ABC transporter ATP-binding protein [Candidatus Nanosynbacter sp. HMT-352]
MIELKNVTKIYGKKKNQFVALNDVSLRIPTGVSVAILGKSGSGKSTLMHAISGLDRPQQGEVIIDGQDILKLKQKQVDEFRARKIGFIFQSFFVQGNESVADNVSLPLEIVKMPRGLRESKINEALKAVDLYEKRKNRAKDLSGGQKQRLAIARAIVGSPQIIFADEPTGNLDSETGAKVEELLFNYNKQEGATLIIVTHDVDLAKKCDYQILIKDGKIKGSNIPKEGKSGR